jgi:tRNA wybutosine-synthesizing protein 3
MSSTFQAKKQKIIEQINVPEDQYSDLSPKGSIDEGIRELIREINTISGLVTTSSCAGRISVFLEGQKKPFTTVLQNGPAELPGESDVARPPVTAGPGGKGGGSWLFVSHDPISKASQASTTPSHHSLFGMISSTTVPKLNIEPGARFVHFKFEAMVRSSHLRP